MIILLLFDHWRIATTSRPLEEEELRKKFTQYVLLKFLWQRRNHVEIKTIKLQLAKREEEIALRIYAFAFQDQKTT